jgi:hypothetical protein
MASPAPWISDPTATDSRVRRGPHRAPGARVHGGPPASNEGVRDPSHPREIERPRMRASDGRRRCRRREAARGGSSPALALDGAPGHQHDHKLAQNVEGAHAHVTEGSRGRSCLVGGCSGELVGTLLCTKGREKGLGLLLTVACRTSSDGGSGKRSEGAGPLLTDKRRIPLRSASVRTPHLFHHGITKVLVNPRSKGITSVRSTTTH